MLENPKNVGDFYSSLLTMIRLGAYVHEKKQSVHRNTDVANGF